MSGVDLTLGFGMAISDLSKEWTEVYFGREGCKVYLPDRNMFTPAFHFRSGKDMTPSRKVVDARVRDITGVKNLRALLKVYLGSSEMANQAVRNTILVAVNPVLSSVRFSNQQPMLTLKGVGGQEVVFDMANFTGEAKTVGGDIWRFGKQDVSSLMEVSQAVASGGMVNFVNEGEEGFDE